jgi:Subtilase family
MKVVLPPVIVISIVVIPAFVAAQIIVTNDDDNSTGLFDLISNWQCDFYEDTCNLAWQLDQQCDAPFSYGNCLNMDCWDCDPCRAFDFDCSGCMATVQEDNSGCHWCPGDARCRSVPLGQDFWSLHPQWVTSCPDASDWKQSCDAIHDDNVYTDPLYDSMKWMYDMINVESVWRLGITGAGVHVRINDVGFDATHVEFLDKFDVTRSCVGFVSDSTEQGFHGTAVASILAAGAGNDECAVGIAPDVTLSGCAFQPDFIEEDLVNMMASQLEGVDISHNSWGPTVCFNLEQIRRRLQEQPENKCIFDPTHPSSPCGDCTSDGGGQSGSDQACAQSIINYCSSYFEHDQVACAEFLDLFITYVSCRRVALMTDCYLRNAQHPHSLSFHSINFALFLLLVASITPCLNMYIRHFYKALSKEEGERGSSMVRYSRTYQRLNRARIRAQNFDTQSA